MVPKICHLWLLSFGHFWQNFSSSVRQERLLQSFSNEKSPKMRDMKIVLFARNEWNTQVDMLFLMIKKWFWHHETRFSAVNKTANFLKICTINSPISTIIRSKFQVSQVISTLFSGVWAKTDSSVAEKSINTVGNRIKVWTSARHHACSRFWNAGDSPAGKEK